MRFQKTILSILLDSLLPLLGIMGLIVDVGVGIVLGENSVRIESSLKDAFMEDSNATKNIIVEFNEKASSVLGMFNFTEMSTAEELTEFTKNYKFQLKTLSMDSQKTTLQYLKENTTAKHEMFWVTNQLFVKDASSELVNDIIQYGGVALVRQEKIFHILKPMKVSNVMVGRVGGNVFAKDTVKNIEWNIHKINADQIWTKVRAELPNNWTDTVVGVIDTGVHSEHEAFPAGTVIGWKDAINGKSQPYDDNGHGTHVTGTVCGQNGIGVAPGAKIVSCKACTKEGACPESALTSCAQFMTEQKPHVVSNSWGGPSGTADYADVINGWKALNIFSVFAAGNEGPSCKTIGSPADYSNVGCSVGATTMSDGLADFSSRGPFANGMVGPAVSAPGEGITSAWPGANNAYRSLSGTSMATPHVAGLYALMHSVNPGVTFDQARSAIVHSCMANGLADPHQKCGETSFSKVPNNMYGNGRVDCVKATQVVSKINSKGELLM